MQNIPEEGASYPARLNGKMAIQMNETGSVMVYVPFALVAPDIQFTGKHSACISDKSGTPMKATLESLAKIFHLETEIRELQEIEPNDDGAAQFMLKDCYYDNSYTPPGADGPIRQIKFKWINPLGGAMRMPPQLDASGLKKLQMKFGGKFKAILAAVDHSAADEAAEEQPGDEQQTETGKAGSAPPPPRRSAAPPPPSRTAVARTSTQEEVWAQYEAAHPNPNKKATKEQQEQHIAKLGDQFWKKVEEIVPAQDGQPFTGDLSLEDWGTVADTLGY